MRYHTTLFTGWNKDMLFSPQVAFLKILINPFEIFDKNYTYKFEEFYPLLYTRILYLM